MHTPPTQSLATRLATVPGLVRTGAASWVGDRTPIHPLSMESAYADPELLRDLGARGARFAHDLGIDVERLSASLAGVGAEVAGVFVLGVLDPAVHALSVDAVVNRWTENDPRWDLLPAAA
jgi:hypothetical protein